MHGVKSVTEVRILIKDAGTVDPTLLGKIVLDQLKQERPVVVGLVEKL